MMGNVMSPERAEIASTMALNIASPLVGEADFCVVRRIKNRVRGPRFKKQNVVSHHDCERSAAGSDPEIKQLVCI